MTTIRSTSRRLWSRPVAYTVGIAGCVIGCAVLVTVLAGEFRTTAWQPWDGEYAEIGRLAIWLVASVSEPQYYAVASASAGLLLGGAFAQLAYRRSWTWQGFVQACGSGIWPWAVGSGVSSLVLGNLLWGWTLGAGQWQPLFVPLVSVAPAIVIHFGPRWSVAVTGTVLGALLTPPIALLAIKYICEPWDLPLVVGATGGMTVGAVIAFWLCGRLPWMPSPGRWRGPGAASPEASRFWVVRRALADFSEAQFFGNEWASAALILGALLVHLLNPSLLVYGSGLFPEVLASQVLTAVAGVLLWRRKWAAHGFYPTFVPVVSVAPATVLAFGGTAQSVVAGALLGAIVGPPVAAAIAARLPNTFHPFIGNVASMTLCTAVAVPVLGLLPGFAA
ncbi:hypothetical protein FB561_3783 [Kribbella amoyensis]|uniref:Uncharacterized protein n=1 Tax=Kribbella amoyensis TaxID=996641 RepID=A0A561BUY2_9ACTN|nr:hypothetical protein [Kribbella amoyensis]TWD82647.1 hypothetical protein FB561_3783 [Kribbella amoyensis]